MRNGFDQDAWAPYARPGHFNDPDMLVAGVVGWGHPHPTRLTPDEQYSLMSMWCLSASPLILGNDLTQLDAFTLGLLTNDEVLDVDQDSLGRQATMVAQGTTGPGNWQVYAKPLHAAPCRDISVVGCTLTTRCAAFKIGTESAGDFSAVRVSDCHIIEANLGAVKILSVDGANISDVRVENLRVESADTPIFLRLGNRGRTFRGGSTVRPAGSLTGVTIRDVHVKQARRIGILLAGIPGHDISDVLLQRIDITMVGEPVKVPVPDPPENAGVYPEIRMFGPALPASGLYCRHARNVKMDDIEIISVPGDTRPEKVCLDS